MTESVLTVVVSPSQTVYRTPALPIEELLHAIMLPFSILVYVYGYGFGFKVVVGVGAFVGDYQS